MSRRTWFKDASSASPGMVYGNAGFLTTLIGTNPALATAFGFGGQVGPDAAGLGAATSGPAFIKSVVKTANNGEYLVTLQDGYRKVWGVEGNLLGVSAGPADGAWAQCCAPLNEGAGHETPITFLVTTMNAAGVPTEFNGRVLMIAMALKDSGAGA
jgi:hypothetical protein